jgi:UDP-N-acetylmuramate--alanine ligase
MDLNTVKKVHLIGIGGIGISALAQLFAKEGRSVCGTDNAISSKVREVLESNGVTVYAEHSINLISTDTDLVVYSDAITEDSDGFVELAKARELGITTLSYFEALGEVTKGRFTIAVSGTHGKTTTSAILTKILKDVGKNPTAIIGSIVKDFGSNFVAGKEDLFVVEACEYKDHILKLHPQILVITNLEWDHTDFFPNLSAVQDTFRKAIESLPRNAVVVTNVGDPNIAPILRHIDCKVIDYSNKVVMETPLLGEFNEMNARAAVCSVQAIYQDVSSDEIKSSLASYKGSWRRFEYKGMTENGVEVYDDYAHHPTAIQKTLKAVKAKFIDKRIIAAFHPHLYSRTSDLMEGFANAFTDADEVLIAPIYSARELPIQGVTSEVLSRKITATGVRSKAFRSLEAVEQYLREHTSAGDIVITMGAGDIYKVADALVKSS